MHNKGNLLLLVVLLQFLTIISLRLARANVDLHAQFAEACLERIELGVRCPATLSVNGLTDSINFCTTPAPVDSTTQPITLAAFSSPHFTKTAQLQPQLQTAINYPLRLQSLTRQRPPPPPATTNSSSSSVGVSGSIDGWSVPYTQIPSLASDAASAAGASDPDDPNHDDGVPIWVSEGAATTPWDLAPDADAWLTESGRVGEAQTRGYTADLSHGVSTAEGLGWYGIDQAWRDMTGIYNQSIYAVPLGGGSLHLLYRRDVLAAEGAAPPSTWDELATLAERLQGRPMGLLEAAAAAAAKEEKVASGSATAGAAGEGDYGICLDIRQRCAAHLYLTAIWAPMGVSQGTHQGLFFDPNNRQPLLNTPAFKTALTIWATLAALSPPPITRTTAMADTNVSMAAAAEAAVYLYDDCTRSGAAAADIAVHPMFAAGRCALTLASTGAVKALLRTATAAGSASASAAASGTGGVGIGISGPETYSQSPVLGSTLVGVAPLPGSTVVLDRTTGQLTSCSWELCPHGEHQAASAMAAAAPLSASASATASSAQTVESVGSVFLINRAPVIGLGHFPVGLVSSRVPPWRQAFALQVLSAIAGPEASWRLVLDPDVAVGPARKDQLQWEGSDGGGTRWAAAGYDTTALVGLFAEVSAAVRHVNAVPPLSVPGAEQIMVILRWAADQMTEAAVATAVQAATGKNIAESASTSQASTSQASTSQASTTENGPRRFSRRGLLDDMPSDTTSPPRSPSVSTTNSGTPAAAVAGSSAGSAIAQAAAAVATAAQAQVLRLLWVDSGGNSSGEQHAGLRLEAARLPLSSLLYDTMQSSSSPTPPPAAVTGVGALWLNVTLATVQHLYFASIHSLNYYYGDTGLQGTPAVAGPRPHHGGVIFMQVGVPVICVTSVALAVLLVLKTHNATGKAYYAVDAPPVSADTCLIVTDVQDSTVLWELLPAHVMDTAMQVHHTTLRKHLVRYSGYEAATEGDSFILAFYNATEALRYALTTQQALLDAQWPPELLRVEACEAVWLMAVGAPTSRPEALLNPFTRRMLMSGRNYANRPSLTAAAVTATTALPSHSETGVAGDTGGIATPSTTQTSPGSQPFVFAGGGGGSGGGGISCSSSVRGGSLHGGSCQGGGGGTVGDGSSILPSSSSLLALWRRGGGGSGGGAQNGGNSSLAAIAAGGQASAVSGVGVSIGSPSYGVAMDASVVSTGGGTTESGVGTGPTQDLSSKTPLLQASFHAVHNQCTGHTQQSILSAAALPGVSGFDGGINFGEPQHDGSTCGVHQVDAVKDYSPTEHIGSPGPFASDLSTTAPSPFHTTNKLSHHHVSNGNALDLTVSVDSLQLSKPNGAAATLTFTDDDAIIQPEGAAVGKDQHRTSSGAVSQKLPVALRHSISNAEMGPTASIGTIAAGLDTHMAALSATGVDGALVPAATAADAPLRAHGLDNHGSSGEYNNVKHHTRGCNEGMRADGAFCHQLLPLPPLMAAAVADVMTATVKHGTKMILGSSGGSQGGTHSLPPWFCKARFSHPGRPNSDLVAASSGPHEVSSSRCSMNGNNRASAPPGSFRFTNGLLESTTQLAMVPSGHTDTDQSSVPIQRLSARYHTPPPQPQSTFVAEKWTATAEMGTSGGSCGGGALSVPDSYRLASCHSSGATLASASPISAPYTTSTGGVIAGHMCRSVHTIPEIPTQALSGSLPPSNLITNEVCGGAVMDTEAEANACSTAILEHLYMYGTTTTAAVSYPGGTCPSGLFIPKPDGGMCGHNPLPSQSSDGTSVGLLCTATTAPSQMPDNLASFQTVSPSPPPQSTTAVMQSTCLLPYSSSSPVTPLHRLRNRSRRGGTTVSWLSGIGDGGSSGGGGGGGSDVGGGGDGGNSGGYCGDGGGGTSPPTPKLLHKQQSFGTSVSAAGGPIGLGLSGIMQLGGSNSSRLSRYAQLPSQRSSLDQRTSGPFTTAATAVTTVTTTATNATNATDTTTDTATVAISSTVAADCGDVSSLHKAVSITAANSSHRPFSTKSLLFRRLSTNRGGGWSRGAATSSCDGSVRGATLKPLSVPLPELQIACEIEELKYKMVEVVEHGASGEGSMASRGNRCRFLQNGGVLSSSHDTSRSRSQMPPLLTFPSPLPSPSSPSSDDIALPFYQSVAARWHPAALAGAPGAVLAFRGLRVRIGLHAGVSSRSEMAYNRAAARMMYCGPVLRAAKAVADTAHGGQVVLSSSAFAGLSQWMLNGEDSVMVWFGGRHMLQDDLPPQDLFIAFSRPLLARAGLLPPALRSPRGPGGGVIQSGTAEALVGPVVLAALELQDAGALAAELGGGAVWERCVGAYESVGVQLMRLLGGAQYECEDGLILAGFPSARAAVLWLLHAQALLMAVPWEKTVLASQYCERKTYSVRQMSRGLLSPCTSMVLGGGGVARGGRQLVTLAGPRVKGVADLTHIAPEIQRSSGRLVISPRQRQRLQRLLSATRPGQVVVTSLVETAFAAEAPPAPRAPVEAAADASLEPTAAAVDTAKMGAASTTVPPAALDDDGNACAPPPSAPMAASAAAAGGSTVLVPAAVHAPSRRSLVASLPTLLSPIGATDASSVGSCVQEVAVVGAGTTAVAGHGDGDERKAGDENRRCSTGCSREGYKAEEIVGVDMKPSHAKAATAVFATSPAAADDVPCESISTAVTIAMGIGGGDAGSRGVSACRIVERAACPTTIGAILRSHSLWRSLQRYSRMDDKVESAAPASSPTALPKWSPRGVATRTPSRLRLTSCTSHAALAAAPPEIETLCTDAVAGGASTLRGTGHVNSSISASIMMLPGLEAVRFLDRSRTILERLGLLKRPPPPPASASNRLRSLVQGAGTYHRHYHFFGPAAAAAAATAVAELISSASRRYSTRRPSRGTVGGADGTISVARDGSHVLVHRSSSAVGAAVSRIVSQSEADGHGQLGERSVKNGGGGGGSAIGLLHQLVERTASRCRKHALGGGSGGGGGSPGSYRPTSSETHVSGVAGTGGGCGGGGGDGGGDGGGSGRGGRRGVWSPCRTESITQTHVGRLSSERHTTAARFHSASTAVRGVNVCDVTETAVAGGDSAGGVSTSSELRSPTPGAHTPTGSPTTAGAAASGVAVRCTTLTSILQRLHGQQRRTVRHVAERVGNVACSHDSASGSGPAAITMVSAPHCGGIMSTWADEDGACGEGSDNDATTAARVVSASDMHNVRRRPKVGRRRRSQLSPLGGGGAAKRCGRDGGHTGASDIGVCDYGPSSSGPAAAMGNSANSGGGSARDLATAAAAASGVGVGGENGHGGGGVGGVGGVGAGDSSLPAHRRAFQMLSAGLHRLGGYHPTSTSPLRDLHIPESTSSQPLQTAMLPASHVGGGGGLARSPPPPPVPRHLRSIVLSLPPPPAALPSDAEGPQGSIQLVPPPPTQMHVKVSESEEVPLISLQLSATALGSDMDCDARSQSADEGGGQQHSTALVVMPSVAPLSAAAPTPASVSGTVHERVQEIAPSQTSAAMIDVGGDGGGGHDGDGDGGGNDGDGDGGGHDGDGDGGGGGYRSSSGATSAHCSGEQTLNGAMHMWQREGESTPAAAAPALLSPIVPRVHATDAPPPGLACNGDVEGAGNVGPNGERELVFVRVPPALSSCPHADEVLHELHASVVRIMALEAEDPRVSSSLGCGLCMCLLEASSIIGLSSGSGIQPNGSEAGESAEESKKLFPFLWRLRTAGRKVMGVNK